MYLSSLFLFVMILIIALNTLPTSGKAVKTTTTLVPKITKVLATVKPPVMKPVIIAKVDKKKNRKQQKKSKKSKKSPWKIPNADQKKLFNDYKTILRIKITARNSNITGTYQLEPVKYGSQTLDNDILHHYIIKLPDSKYAYGIICTTKDGKKGTSMNENSVSIRRTIYNNLAAAEAS